MKLVIPNKNKTKMVKDPKIKDLTMEHKTVEAALMAAVAVPVVKANKGKQ